MPRQTFDKDKQNIKNSNEMEEFIKTIKPDSPSPYDTFKQRVMAECNVSRQSFNNWENGKAIQEKFKPIIDRIALEMFGRAVFGEEGGEE